MISNNVQRKRYRKLLNWSFFFLIVAKGILHFTSDLKYDAIFKNEANWVQWSFGFILLLMALLFAVKRLRPHLGFGYSLITLVLLTQSYCSFKVSGFLLEQYVEHALQIFMPLIVLFEQKKFLSKRTRLYFYLSLISLTFIGHGLFAIGFHVLPDNFLTMTKGILLVNEDFATHFLLIFGVLDLLVAILVFIPRTRTISLYYMIIWGLLTALARVVYGAGNEPLIETLLVFFPNTLFRLCHGLIPWFVLLKYSYKENLMMSKQRVSVA